ncbi:hypothetical protein LSTR_LSTR003413 [Laodelphax striatellus]|uniref:HMG box domain-containing protein n=1 Tax=Laodelphax striatellus TaxID=195883 RepID=A0A482X266_LAOST|nr:hypothetical protein LSTR_LSTR003413 [Laodelphax striatellus]
MSVFSKSSKYCLEYPMKLEMTDPSRFARRPPNAFLIFCKKNRPIARKHNPNVENRQITKILGDWWAHLDDAEKSVYKKLSNKNKDKFFQKNPDFKWYKLPAPPLHRLRTRPSNKKFKKEEIKNETITPGKLADENQLGGLTSLITPPKPPNKRYLELNYYKSGNGETSGTAPSMSYNKNMMSFDVPSVEVKEEPQDSKEGEVNEKNYVEINGIIEFKSDHPVRVNNRPSFIAYKENSLSLDSNIFKTSQQKIIDCVVDNSFKNDKKVLSSNYCSTKADCSYRHKIFDQYSGTNKILYNENFNEKPPFLNRMNGAANNSALLTHHNKAKMPKIVESYTNGNENDVTIYDVENDSNLNNATSYNAVNTKIVAYKTLNCTWRNGAQYERSMGSSQMDVDGFTLKDGAVEQFSRRQSERIRRRKGLIDYQNIQTKMEEDNDDDNAMKSSILYKEGIFNYLKPESENSSKLELEQTASDDTNLLESEIKYESNFQFKSEEKYNPTDYIDLEFEKEVQELPELKYEDYLIKKKEKQQQKINNQKKKRKATETLSNVFLDHSYTQVSKRTRGRKQANPQDSNNNISYNNSNNNNNNNNSNNNSNNNILIQNLNYDYQPNEKRAAYRKHYNRVRFSRAIDSNATIIKVETPTTSEEQSPEHANQRAPGSSLWDEPIIITVDPSQTKEQPQQQKITGSRKRKNQGIKTRIVKPQPGSECVGTSDIQAAMTLIDFASGAYINGANLPN